MSDQNFDNHVTDDLAVNTDLDLRHLHEQLLATGEAWRRQPLDTTSYEEQLRRIAIQDRLPDPVTDLQKEWHFMEQTSTAPVVAPSHLRRRFVLPTVAAALLVVVLSVMVFGVLRNHSHTISPATYLPTPFKATRSQFPSGTIKHFSTDPYNATNLVYGADGNLWFTTKLTDQRDGVITWDIGRMTPAGKVSVFPVNYTYSDPEGGRRVGPFSIPSLLWGPDGSLWFVIVYQYASLIYPATNVYANTIMRMTPSGQFTEFPIPPPPENPPLGFHISDLIVGPGNNLWFVGQEAYEQGTFAKDRIGHMSLTGKVSWLAIPVVLSIADNLVWGPDGAFWLISGNMIERVTTTGSLTSYQISFVGRVMAIGTDGNLWIGSLNDLSSQDSAEIARFDIRNHKTMVVPIMRYYDPSGAQVRLDILSLVPGPDGNEWFTAQEHNTLDRQRSLGVITPTGETNSFPLSEQGPINGLEPTEVISGADGNLWFSAEIDNQSRIPIHSEIVRLTP